MSILEHFDHSEKKQDKEHFKHLIQVALADGKIEDNEFKMLHRLGKNMGFTDPEIDDLLESTKQSAYNPPYELSRRFEQIYGIVKMVLADDKIDNNEMRLATGLALKSGFSENEIPALLVLLIDGIKKGEDEEDLFKIYKKRIMIL
ncbi:MAG: hypothetical protein K0M40_03775 [Prolixibacteraceae bacterium]|nr:hypothetical protein [Prolixibacteraceae bacterium]